MLFSEIEVDDINKIMIYVDDVVVTLREYLRQVFIKHDEETEEEFNERKDWFIGYSDYEILKYDQDLKGFCVWNQLVICEILEDSDVYILNTENVFKSLFKPQGEELESKPLVQWKYETAIRFFEIPTIKEQYGNPDNLLDQYNEAEMFYDKDNSTEFFNAVKSGFEK